LLSIAASIVDHLATRAAFAIIGMIVALLFVVFGADFLRVNPASEPESFAVGIAMVLGQIGWWARILFRSATLRSRRFLQVAVLVLLCVGIAVVLYGLAFMPRGPLALPLLLTLLGSGVLMVLGTAPHPRAGA